MRHLFVLNPAAGKNQDYSELFKTIDSFMRDYGEDYEIYLTKAPMDAAEKVRRESIKGDDLRVYACGGDGTLSECMHGAAGYSNVAVAHYPCGTGNDFIKTFDENIDLFRDIPKMVAGESIPLDIIDVNGRKCVNICSVGIDARVGEDVHKYSRFPLVKGKGAYIMSLSVNLIKGLNTNMTITVGDQKFSGSHALTCICNGQYYGGGFHPSSTAIPDDGELDFLIVKKVSRISAAMLLKKYSEGKYYELPDYITHLTGRKIDIEADKEFTVNVDGESLHTKKAEIRLVPGGVNFILPQGCVYKNVKNEEIKAN